MPSLASPALRWRIIFLGSAGVFLALALLARSAGVPPGEQLIYDSLIGWASPTAVAFFTTIRYLGRWQLLAALLLFRLGPAETRRWWWLWAAVMILAPMAEGVGKQIIARPRPSGHASGFPGGDVTVAAAYFSLMTYLVGHRLRDRKLLLWVVAWIFVILVGIARIVGRAHTGPPTFSEESRWGWPSHQQHSGGMNGMSPAPKAPVPPAPLRLTVAQPGLRG